MTNKEEDIETIDRVLSGDKMAFTRLVEKYQDMVYTLAFKVVGRPEDAEDVAQEVFLKCYKSLRSFDNQSRFSTWLYRIAYNQAIDHLRKDPHKKSFLEERALLNIANAGDTPCETNLDYKTLQLFLKEAVARLPAVERIIVLLYYYDDQSLRDIADVVGIKEGNVKIRLHRIRQKLEQRLRSKKEFISSLIT